MGLKNFYRALFNNTLSFFNVVSEIGSLLKQITSFDNSNLFEFHLNK